MLKEMAASNAAKLIAACVCPIAGTAALTVSVPQVRSAVHKMTAPPKRTARVKPRARKAPAAQAAKAEPEAVCPEPVLLAGAPFVPSAAAKLPSLSFGGGDPLAAGASRAGPGDVFASSGGGFGGGGGGAGGFFGPTSPEATEPGEGERGGDPPGDGVPMPGVVPEPATWLQMILGFALLGATLRTVLRRRWRGAAQSTSRQP